MTTRDYVIIFLLLLPFFITLPWLIVSRQSLGEQKELVELTRDTLHLQQTRFIQLEGITEPLRTRNAALEKDNAMLVEKLTERGVKVITRELPPPVGSLLEGEAAQREKLAELAANNEQLRAKVVALEAEVNRPAPPPPPAPARVRPAARPATVATAPSSPTAPRATKAPTTTPPNSDAVTQRTAVRPKPKATVAPTPQEVAPVVTLAPVEVTTLQVNEAMREQLIRTGIAGLFGDDFSVDLFDRKEEGAPVAKGQRIVVDFDLQNVPATHHGPHGLYLVVTDRSGQVITSERPIKAQVPFSGTTIDLTATAKSSTVFGESQHLSIQQDLPGRLTKGRYRAQVYSDLAVLGVVDFVVK